MGATIRFKNADLKKVIDYTMEKRNWHIDVFTAIHKYEKATGKEWDFNGKLPEKFRASKTPTLYVVKDNGIYIMATSGVTEELKKMQDHERPDLCYGVGYNPNTDGDIYDKCVVAVGSDDMGETIDLYKTGIDKIIKRGNDLGLRFTAQHMTIVELEPKQTSRKKASS